ncbi:MAG: flagellar biosynthesis anti-sigma factor FlgM [Holophaga sp.]|nr:flagellar biosynthesis anti-sigma factor FlgM [Holophaga sp.]
MRVTGKSSSVGAPQNAGGAKPASGATAAAAASGTGAVGDALSVSSTAQFIAVVRAKIAKVPEIRTAKVEALRAKLQSNGYNPDGEAVADGLVREHTPPRREP